MLGVKVLLKTDDDKAFALSFGFEVVSDKMGFI